MIPKETKLEVECKRPGCNSRRVKTSTIYVADEAQKRGFILYLRAIAALQTCGITDFAALDYVGRMADKVFRRRTRPTGRNVSFLLPHSTVNWSLMPQILEQNGYVKRCPRMDAHHCDGNRYNQRVANGVFVSIATHKKFHLGAKKAAAQGYDAFIAFVESLKDPDLLAHYVNPEHRVLFRSETDNQMQQDVILEFFGSVERYNRFCSEVLARTENQVEKEIHFTVTL